NNDHKQSSGNDKHDHKNEGGHKDSSGKNMHEHKGKVAADKHHNNDHKQSSGNDKHDHKNEGGHKDSSQHYTSGHNDQNSSHQSSSAHEISVGSSKSDQVIIGTAGHDSFVFSNAAVHNNTAITIHGECGNDWINFTNVSGQAHITFSDGQTTNLNLQGGSQHLNLTGAHTAGTIHFDNTSKGGVTFDHIEKFVF
ncbi:MAG: hypothetical protein K2X98_01030, partial [Alphaproteobacteria bacterium]|nr:hypothetical protein [Alphaproteobacteria bacterium]